MKKMIAIAVTLTFLAMLVAQEASARAGGGKSGGMGSRGSKSYSAPSKPSQSTSSPSQAQRQQQSVAPAPAPAAQPSKWGGFMGMMAGGLLGGLIGNMLFSSFAHGGMGSGGFGGPGLFDIILIGIIIFIIYKFVASRKKKEAPAYSGGYQQYSGQGYQQQTQIPTYDAGPVYDAPAPTSQDPLIGLSHIRQLDGTFEESRFKETASDIFFKVQAAWMARNMDSARNVMTQEMYSLMTSEVEKLKAEKRINRLENIAVRNIEITEAWQEEGKDFITIEINANVLDYVTDEAGRVIEGSNTDPVKFVEYWTFVRAAGPNQWQLSAIQQA